MMFKRFLYIIICAALVTACSTSRRSLRNTMVGGLTGMEYMEKVLEISPSRKNITGKAAIEVRSGNGKPLSFTSNIRIRRGEVIRFSVAPMLGIEVARVDITPDGILAIDRLHKRYVRAGFDELSSLVNTELSFNIIQSLFMNELFLPGKNELSSADAERFSLVHQDSSVKLGIRNTGRIEYSFLASASSGRIEETIIGLKNTGYSIHCKYDDFTLLKDNQFPQKMSFYTEGTSKPYALDMNLSRLGTDSNWDSKTELSSKYKRIPLSELLRMLLEH